MFSIWFNLQTGCQFIKITGTCFIANKILHNVKTNKKQSTPHDQNAIQKMWRVSRLLKSSIVKVWQNNVFTANTAPKEILHWPTWAPIQSISLIGKYNLDYRKSISQLTVLIID